MPTKETRLTRWKYSTVSITCRLIFESQWSFDKTSVLERIAQPHWILDFFKPWNAILNFYLFDWSCFGMFWSMSNGNLSVSAYWTPIITEDLITSASWWYNNSHWSDNHREYLINHNRQKVILLRRTVLRRRIDILHSKIWAEMLWLCDYLEGKTWVGSRICASPPKTKRKAITEDVTRSKQANIWQWSLIQSI